MSRVTGWLWRPGVKITRWYYGRSPCEWCDSSETVGRKILRDGNSLRDDPSFADFIDRTVGKSVRNRPVARDCSRNWSNYRTSISMLSTVNIAVTSLCWPRGELRTGNRYQLCYYTEGVIQLKYFYRSLVALSVSAILDFTFFAVKLSRARDVVSEGWKTRLSRPEIAQTNTLLLAP